LSVFLPATAQPPQDRPAVPPAPALAAAPNRNPAPERPANAPLVADPVVIPEATLKVVQMQYVPALRDGAMEFIGTEVKPGDTVPAGSDNREVKEFEFGDTKKLIRELKEGDVIREGDLLGRLDARLALSEFVVAEAKVKAAIADLDASEKTREEARARYDTQQRLKRSGNATSEEEVRGALVTWQRYIAEAVSKRSGIDSAKAELQAAKTKLELHELRSKITGQIKRVEKRKGEAVKAGEPVFEVLNYDVMKVEGKVPTRYLPLLKKGIPVVVEPRITQAPLRVLQGHVRAVTGVAVSNDPKRPLIVSASEDETVRVWDRTTQHELRVLRHPRAVRAVACTPSGAAGHLALSGCDDGIARLWDLSADADRPVRELAGGHAGRPVNAVAFSPDGKWCGTGGDDGAVVVWDAATGEKKFTTNSSAGHRNAVTSLQFLPGNRLLSAARDNTIQLWEVGGDGLKSLRTLNRDGSVQHVTASPDGQRVLVDLGSELRVVSVPAGRVEARLENAGSAVKGFSGLAMFSPDGRLALTAGLDSGKLQLWRMPTASTRAYELRQLEPADRSAATCGAFAPDGSFAVSGNSDNEVYVWATPTREEVEHQLVATVTHIESAVENSQNQVRIVAELPNKDHRLIPGWTVTMVAYPR
jgi:WD40 repeat protein